MSEKRILDESTRKSLLGYLPFSVSSSVDFTPEQFGALDENLRPVFYVRSFKQSEIQELRKNYASIGNTKKSEAIQQISDDNLQVVRRCLVGWRNLFDAGTGEEIEYTKDTDDNGCDKKIWSTFPVWLVRELMEYIRKISGLTSVEELSLKSSPVCEQD
jgi:hypothetical protein